MPVFEQIGGRERVVATVNRLAERIAQDTENNPAFVRLSSEESRDTLYTMLIHLLSGEYSRRGPEALALVAELRLSPKQARVLMHHVKRTLEEMGVAPDVVAEVMGMADLDFLNRGRKP